MYHQISKCRICGNKNLAEILDLGEMTLTGVFPSSRDQKIEKGPLRLVKCIEQPGDFGCGLLQLQHSYALEDLYGEHYGYRSGLNLSMVAHLHRKVEKICKMMNLNSGDIIIDIGSNDATTLKAYPSREFRLIGIDPTAQKFAEFYTKDITPIYDFFNVDVVKSAIGSDKVKVITSFSMFYDLEDPVCFAEGIAELLHEEGIWVCEQSYMPTMLKQNSFDTICHEHLEYYGLRQIQWIADKVGLKILDVELNDVNGGSFSIILAKKDSPLKINTDVVEGLMHQELLNEMNTLNPYTHFARRIQVVKQRINDFFSHVHQNSKVIYGLGASTKGNVILQYCGLTKENLSAIGEVNKDKYGCYTPGSLIPILPEAEILEAEADFLFVLPWHFKSFFSEKLKSAKARLVYPIPGPKFAEEMV
ncbi:MAG: class I SAM-dependent methyltransferase [Parachlamydiales bacterium]|nr:class I SAM-dependent methyltransferase [Parachlamydiales bacterium]